MLLVIGMLCFLVGGVAFCVAIAGVATKEKSVWLIATPIAALALIGWITFNHLNNIQEIKIQTSETAFAATAHDLFLGIKNEATGLSNQSNPVAGTIILKDSATVLITPNSLSTPKTSGLTTEAFYPISLNTRGQDLKISGSLSADNKSWCFQISGEGHGAVYTQLGYAVDGSYCFQGLAYSANDQLVH